MLGLAPHSAVVIWLSKGTHERRAWPYYPVTETVSRPIKNWGFGFLRFWPKTAVSVSVLV